MLEKLFARTAIPLYSKLLDFTSLRQDVIANNIANVDTPKYRSLEVSFKDQLENSIQPGKKLALVTTNPKHFKSNSADISELEPQIKEAGNLKMRNDLNDVDIDREMAKLADNNLLYDASAKIISGSFKSLKNVITENT